MVKVGNNHAKERRKLELKVREFPYINYSKFLNMLDTMVRLNWLLAREMCGVSHWVTWQNNLVSGQMIDGNVSEKVVRRGKGSMQPVYTSCFMSNFIFHEISCLLSNILSQLCSH